MLLILIYLHNPQKYLILYIINTKEAKDLRIQHYINLMGTKKKTLGM